jgi:hypothetical protein
VGALTIFNGELIAGGSFTTAGGISASKIARWDGTDWQPLGSGMNDSVRSLTVYNGELIAGGYFTTAGGVSANHIARWNGTTWQPLGTGTVGPDPHVPALTVYNGELIAGGPFTVAGGYASAHWARWGPACPRGDMICDQVVDEVDVPDFVAALLDPGSLTDCTRSLANVSGDVELDGAPRVDGGDIQPFVACVLGGSCP